MNNLNGPEQWILSNRAQAVALLQSFVREPSIQGNEAGVQNLVEAKLKSLGMEIDRWDPPVSELKKSPWFIQSRSSYEGSPNVVGVLKGTGGGKSILLNGHIDVVPAGDLTQWTDNPFSGIERDGKVYGRGSTDMKGGNTAMMLAVESIVRSGIRLKGDIIFHSVVEEETGGVGTLAAVLRGHRADAALVPEPTNMKLFISQQGSMWFRISVPGLGAHAGTRYEGVSAVEKAWKIFEAVSRLEKKRNSKVENPLYKNVPIPFPINIGKFNSGAWPSSVPDLAVMEGRIGVAPGESMDAVRNELIAAVEEVNHEDAWLKEHPALVEFFGGQWIPNQVSENHPFTQLIKQEFNSVFNSDPVVEASPWGTDAGILGQAGNIPALVIGPGTTRLAHYPDEYIEIAPMLDCARLFSRVIVSWCS
jgi:acetylornithine deacetylase